MAKISVKLLKVHKFSDRNRATVGLHLLDMMCVLLRSETAWLHQGQTKWHRGCLPFESKTILARLPCSVDLLIRPIDRAARRSARAGKQ